MMTVRLESRIAVNPRWKPFFIAAVNGSASLEFLADTLGGKHVAVYAHTYGQDNTCDTRDSQRAACIESEEAGAGCEHAGDLTGEGNDCDKAGQAVVNDHEYCDNDERDNAGDTHCVTRAGTQYRGDGGQILDLELERKRTALDEVSQLLCVSVALVAGVVTGDRSGAVADDSAYGRSADLLVVHPDGDTLVLVHCLLGGILERFLTAVVQGKAYFVACGSALVLGINIDACVCNVLTLEHQGQILIGLVVCEISAVAHAECQLGSRADLLHGLLGIEAVVVGLPREADNDVVGADVLENLVVVDVLADKTVLDYCLCCVEVVRGYGIGVILRRAECYVDAAADIYTPSYVAESCDHGSLAVAVLRADSQCGKQRERDDNNCQNEEHGSAYSSLQK